MSPWNYIDPYLNDKIKLFEKEHEEVEVLEKAEHAQVYGQAADQQGVALPDRPLVVLQFLAFKRLHGKIRSLAKKILTVVGHVKHVKY